MSLGWDLGDGRVTDTVLDVRSLSVTFRKAGTARATGLQAPSRVVTAVDDVSISVGRGEVLGIVGESGSGKSTLCRAIAGLEPVTSGEIFYEGRELGLSRSKTERRAIQMVFQDPYTSLNPSLRIGYVLHEALRAGGVRDPASAPALMSSVGLDESMLAVRPAKLSGGQRQRVAIARALAVNPHVLLADEVTSALDVSIQATIVELLARLAAERHLCLVFVTHNLQVVRALCQRVAVMHAGRLVEAGTVADIFSSPAHPYTRSLIDALPRLHRRRGPVPEGLPAQDEEPGLALATSESSQCFFRLRCPLAHARCAIERPSFSPGKGSGEHVVACHAAGT